ncbi:aquaporin Z [Bifidobacterium bohemicum]|uniref:Membrane channel protein n=1 Tax=Bifidobacterium bohemicum DSM 22767 TaxID=1437606 RepID=A0A086ZJ67_9BIFI|nr:aquaporin [Bifidobacterium bohemicum]KFI46567.1 membrane channel protein [Bifidobacterium bohemicum DSM 22767]SCB75380.1 aquaporin Z [Bifidobacterium bohemicum]
MTLEESQYETVTADETVPADIMSEASEEKSGSKSNLATLLLGTAAEFLGSLLIFVSIYLISAISMTLYGPNVILSSLTTGLAYALMIVIFGRFSGGQFNPAVTLAAILTGKTNIWNGIAYIVAQVLGGIVAGGITILVLPVSQTVPAQTWFAKAINGFGSNSISAASLQNTRLNFGLLLAIIVEIIAGLIITSAALHSMDDDGKPTDTAAVVMGAAYALGAAITHPVTGASLNPARATGIAIFAHGSGLPVDPLAQLLYFWICPIFAATIVVAISMIGQTIEDRQSNEHQIDDDIFIEETAKAPQTEATDTDDADVQNAPGASLGASAGDALE